MSSAMGDEELVEKIATILSTVNIFSIEYNKRHMPIMSDLVKLYKSRDQQIALAARLDESRVSNQLADNNADSHFGSVKIRNELRKRYTALKQAQNKEK